MADTAQIEEIVKQVLASMSGTGAAAPAGNGGAGGAIPRTAHVAMLTGLEHFDVKEFPMPEVGDGDILVKVEASTLGNNWMWRMKPDAIDTKLVRKVRRQTELYGRLPKEQ